MGDSMYNEEIKRKFLEEFDPESKRKGEPERFLQKLEHYEISAGKDAAQMSFEEAQQVVLSLKVGQVSTLRKMLATYRKYTEWCSAYGAFSNTSDGFIKLKTKDVDLSKSADGELFKDEDDFFGTLRQIYSFDDGVADVPYLALIWAGMKPKEVIELKDSEVDIDNRVIYNHDGTIMIPSFSDAVYDVLIQYIQCKRATRGHHSGSKQVVKDMSVDTFLKKMLNPNSKDFGTTYRDSAIKTHIREEYVKHERPGLKQTNTVEVWNSGRNYHLYTVEQSGVDVFAPENKGVVESVFRYEKGYYNAIRMYKDYKKAFNL